MSIIEELTTKADGLAEEIIKLKKLSFPPGLWDEEYLLDSSIAIPSSEVICTLCLCLLNEPDLEKVLIGESEQETKRVISELFNEMSSDDVKIVAWRFCRLEKLLGYEYKSYEEGRRVALWSLLIEHFREPKTACHRFIAKRGINALLNVSLFQNDVEMVKALSPAFSQVLYKTQPKNTNVNRVIGQILYFYPYLKDRLERDPTKEELKSFILHVDIETPDEPRAWSEAHKRLGIYVNKPRERTVFPDHARVSSIAMDFSANPIQL
ncbi:hypothetical protein OAF13_02810 [Akkermansiaceae bacterium]|nr:hypothetical protein [Akkermansiaceae bacterium]